MSFPPEKLYEMKDSTTGKQFEFARGDQCMLAKRNWKPEMPIMAPTVWGTPSERLKDRLDQRCHGSHEHQVLEESNCYGRRSTLETIWGHSVCVEINKETIWEMQTRAEWLTYPAVVTAEDRYEKEPIDQPDMIDFPTADSMLPDAREHEMEMMDNLVLPGMNEDLQKQRDARS